LYLLQESADLLRWLPLGTQSSPNVPLSLLISDHGGTSQFYRAVPLF
jgi:hypothetical protein